MIVLSLLLNTPVTPATEAVNFTFTPETGYFDASRTVTAKALENAVFTNVLCGVVPAFTVIVTGSVVSGTAVAVFESEKITVASPVDSAVAL